jgi:hypothetical protein
LPTDGEAVARVILHISEDLELKSSAAVAIGGINHKENPWEMTRSSMVKAVSRTKINRAVNPVKSRVKAVTKKASRDTANPDSSRASRAKLIKANPATASKEVSTASRAKLVRSPANNS